MDMAKLDFEDESFDGIMAMHSLIHISSEEMPMVLTEFKRVLKSEGKILILAEEGEADKIISESINCNSKMFLNLFTQERLVNFVEQAGFEILEQYITTLININDLPGRGIYIIARKP
jgi:ubiquinone/menaquinone biosynthesis C-methylase UbiE